MRTPHTSTRKGKKVRIVLRNGTVIIGKFKERTANYVILGDDTYNQPIWAGDIKSFGIYKKKMS